MTTGTPTSQPPPGETAPTSHAYADHLTETGWSRVKPATGLLALPPAAAVLQYAQSVFEDFEVVWTQDRGWSSLCLGEHLDALAASAAHLALPVPPRGTILAALESVVDGLPARQGVIIVRVLLFATEPNLEVRPARAHKLVTMAVPGPTVGEPTRLWVDPGVTRSFAGGVGDVVAAGNFGAGMLAHLRAGHAGCDDVLWLDRGTVPAIEAASGGSVFVVAGSPSRPSVSTASASATHRIHPVRGAVVAAARDLSCSVAEQAVPYGALDGGGVTEMSVCSDHSGVRSVADATGTVWTAPPSRPVGAHMTRALSAMRGVQWPEFVAGPTSGRTASVG